MDPRARPVRRPFPPWAGNRRVAGVFALAIVAAAALPLSGLVYPDGHPDPGAALRLGGIATWAAAILVVSRWPPRARAPRQDGVPVLRRSAVRRLAGVAFAAPLAAAAGLRGGPGLSARIAAVVLLGGLALLDVVARPRTFRLLPDGLEPLGRRGAAGLLRWDDLVSVDVEDGRREAGVVLRTARGAVALSAWLDGSAELAAELLARAPREALAAPGARDGLVSLAAGLERGPPPARVPASSR